MSTTNRSHVMAKSAVKKPAPRSVESLKRLLAQINEYAPKRSKASDGWIGDAKHAARHSDHNAEPDGTVDARDFTNDPSGGMDSQKLCDALIASKDKRISYIICNGKIISGRNGPKPWVPRVYKGTNSHHHHIHVSVLDEGQDDKSDWKIASAFKKTVVKTKPADLGLSHKQVNSVLKRGSKGEYVKDLQLNLKKLGFNIEADGDFGAGTEIAVKTFQTQNKLEVDGWAGPRTVEAIGKAIESLKTDKVEAKLDAAKVIVDEASNGDKNYTTTELAAGAAGVSGIATGAKAVTDAVNDSASSAMSLLTTVGPWVLLALVVVGAAGYIYWSRRQTRIAATAIQKAI